MCAVVPVFQVLIYNYFIQMGLKFQFKFELCPRRNEITYYSRTSILLLCSSLSVTPFTSANLHICSVNICELREHTYYEIITLLTAILKVVVDCGIFNFY